MPLTPYANQDTKKQTKKATEQAQQKYGHLYHFSDLQVFAPKVEAIRMQVDVVGLLRQDVVCFTL